MLRLSSLLMKRLFVCGLLLVSACSKPPDTIKPIAAVGQPFAGYECEALVTERAAYNERLVASIGTQRERVGGDVILAVGFGVIGLAAGKAIAGSDEEYNIGTYRGAIAEIDNEARRKGCTDPSFFQPEPEVKLKSATDMTVSQP